MQGSSLFKTNVLRGKFTRRVPAEVATGSRNLDQCPDGCRWDAATSVGVQFTKIQMKGVCLITAN